MNNNSTVPALDMIIKTDSPVLILSTPNYRNISLACVSHRIAEIDYLSSWKSITSTIEKQNPPLSTTLMQLN